TLPLRRVFVRAVIDPGASPAAPPPAASRAPGAVGHAGSMPTSRRSLRLRVRVGLFFTLAALFVTILLSIVTYYSARTYLLDQRNESARSQAFANARTVRDALSVDSTDP